MRPARAVTETMKKKSLIALAVFALIAVAAVLVHRAAFAREATTYRFAKIEKGDVESTVSATGTLGAVTTVAVGTQVSGQIAELFVDFNDTVKKGQLLARIDPTLQQQAVIDAEAALERVRAQALQAQRENHRNAELMSAGLVARSEYEATGSSLEVARANVRSAQVALDRARQNLEYTKIYAPIDGVVVERNVDLGQTVAASLSAPQLFLIANDLAHMQILAKVGEGDIAGIKEGQTAKFTVQALPKQTFEGRVQQVRLQSTTTENVVNYTVVVSVANAGKQLLPGMTARVSFLTRSAHDVLKVANAALRFKPQTEDATAAKAAPSRRGRGSSALYSLDGKGALNRVRVQTGVTDGSFTEVRGADLREGMQVIAGISQPQTAKSESTSTSPFQATGAQQGGGRQRPGGF